MSETLPVGAPAPDVKRRKLPVMKTAVEALSFGIERYGLTLRVGWFPFVLVFGLYGLLMMAAFQMGGLDFSGTDWSNEAQVEAFFENAGPSFMAAQGAGLLVGLLAPLILAAVRVVLSRVAAGEMAPPRAWIWFRLGSREVLVFVARLLYHLLAGLAIMVAMLAVAAIAFAAAAVADAAGGDAQVVGMAVGFIGGLAATFALAWALVRFSTFVPVAAIDNVLDPARAWNMTRGNFWRIVGAGLLMGIGLVVISIMFMIAAGVAFGIGFALVTLIGLKGAAAIWLAAVFAIALDILFGIYAFGAATAFPALVWKYLRPLKAGEDGSW